MRVMSSCASVSSCFTRVSAALSSRLGSFFVSTLGKGLAARSFWSVLPPPSRFACASASAFCGFVVLLAFTSTTSITLCGASMRIAGGLMLTPTMTSACIATEASSATCIEATSPKRSSRKSEKETSASGEGCLNCICIGSVAATCSTIFVSTFTPMLMFGAITVRVRGAISRACFS